MKILYVAGREQSYSRTHIVLTALQRQKDFRITGCFPPDRSFKNYPELLSQAVRLSRDCDLILVGFYGQIILPPLWLFCHKPILFDMYITTFDTMVYDRAKTKPDSIKAKLFAGSDWLSYRLSKQVVLESQHHIDYFCQKFCADPKRFHRVFLAVDDGVIHPKDHIQSAAPFLVHFHGEFAPFHGVRTILQAAELLKKEAIRFQIVGRGITYKRDYAWAKQHELHNVDFYDPVPYAQLTDMMARADLCLGIFGDNERVSLVVTNKVIEALAAAKPLLTSRNQPVQELVTHEKSAYLIERADPHALAQAILLLRKDNDLRQTIAKGGHDVFQKNCTLQKLGEGFKEIIEEMSTYAI